MADPAKELADAARGLLLALEMQTDYHSLPCREMDVKYGRVIDLTLLADVVSDARTKADEALAAYDLAEEFSKPSLMGGMARSIAKGIDNDLMGILVKAQKKEIAALKRRLAAAKRGTSK